MATKPSELKAFKDVLAQMQEIDPAFAVIVTAAGIAGAAGVQGPLTTLINGIGNLTSATAKEVGNAWTAVNTPGWVYLQQWLNGTPSAPSANATDEEKSAMMRTIGMAAGNMVEAGLLYTLMKNPETLKTLFEMGKTASTGAIGLGKAGATLLGAV